jgi:uncharacterized membrane protein
MTTSQPTPPAETLEKDAELAGVAVAGALRAVEVGAVVLLGLLICPPLAILAVLVAVPLLVTALALGLLAAILAAPYLLVQHFRGDHRHLTVLTHRLRAAGRALLDLAPHRIHSDARKLHPSP